MNAFVPLCHSPPTQSGQSSGIYQVLTIVCVECCKCAQTRLPTTTQERSTDWRINIENNFSFFFFFLNQWPFHLSGLKKIKIKKVTGIKTVIREANRILVRGMFKTQQLRSTYHIHLHGLFVSSIPVCQTTYEFVDTLFFLFTFQTLHACNTWFNSVSRLWL